MSLPLLYNGLRSWRKPYWVNQEADPRSDSDLTEVNKTFMQELRLADSASPLLVKPLEEKPWIPGVTQRCGLVGIKIGVYPMWTTAGKKIDCTIFQIPDNNVIRYVPPSDLDSYLSLRSPRGYWLTSKSIPSWVIHKRWGLQLVGAINSPDTVEMTPAWCGLFKQAGVTPKRKISRFLVSPDAALEPGTPLTVNHFRVGDYLDVTARTINRGFQGVIERWGMRGGPAGHGSTKFHRRMGSAGGAGKKIPRNKHMAGVMGNRYRHSRGLLVVRINPRLGLIYLAGCTPGPVHAYSLLHDSWLVNRRRLLDANPPPVPTGPAVDEDSLVVDDSSCSLFAHDIYHESIHRSDWPSINFASTTEDDKASSRR